MNENLRERASEDHPASWSNLPRKGQLCVLALCRVFDFMQIASFQTVCYYHLKSFNPSLSEDILSWQTGVASSSFSGAQIFTALIWGRVADSEWCGRKKVLIIGLFGTGLCCIGLAFSTSFLIVVFFRFLAGALNGTVGTIRTMISENIEGRKHQSRAFLLLPASFMVANIIGPVCGSWLADPVTTYPSWFGKNSVFGGDKGVTWLAKFPYALPALMSGVSMSFIAMVVVLSIEETLANRTNRPDAGLIFASFLKRKLGVSSIRSYRGYSPVENYEIAIEDADIMANKTKPQISGILRKDRFPRHRILTLNVITTLLAQAIFDFHMGAFGSLLPLFFSIPRSTDSKHLPFIFNGGLGMEPRDVGSALSILGFFGLVLQFLIYPRINSRLGNVQCFRLFCTLFPVAYGLAPFLAIIPMRRTVILWLFINVVLIIHTTGRSFVLPATIVLLNNSATDTSVLGTVHGIGQTTSAVFRTLGPICAGYMFGKSFEYGIIGVVWWIVALIAILGWISSLFIWERRGK